MCTDIFIREGIDSNQVCAQNANLANSFKYKSICKCKCNTCICILLYGINLFPFGSYTFVFEFDLAKLNGV